MHLIASSTTWYAARAGGILAYLLLSATVLAGILLAGKRRVPGFPRFAVEDVHRFVGLLAGLFIAVHIGGVALDTVVPFSLGQLVIPFTAGYRPLATGLGIVALELLLAVSVTNRLRSRLPYRFWRRAHYATLGVWVLATFHGILSGTDRNQTWLVLLYGGTVALVVAAMAVRFLRVGFARRFGTALAASALAFGLVAILAGVPQPKSQSATATKKTTPAVVEIAGAFTGRINDNGAGVVTVAGTAARSAFRIDLLTASGQVSDNALQLRFANGRLCQGTLTSMDERGFAGTCNLPGGASQSVRASWTVSQGRVSGSLSTASAATPT